MRFIAVTLLCAAAVFGQAVWFEPNRGQVGGQTEWIGRSKGAYLYITGGEVVYANKHNVHMRLIRASKGAVVEGAEPTGGYSSYFTGRDESTWFTGIPHYGRVRYKDVYPGIDVVYYGNGTNVEYDFIVKPGADPDRIELAFSEPVRLDRGDLLVAGLRQHRPRVIQSGREIEASYRLTEQGHVQIAVAAYDPSIELTVDPVLEFSTYLGGPGEDHVNALATDSNGFIYVAGGTQSPATPGLDPFQQTNVVSLTPFVLKLTSDGRRVLFFAELGASGWDYAQSITLDSSSDILLVGSTRSPTFPLKNATQTEFRAGMSTVFVSKLSGDGKALLYSTYFGGSYWDYPGPVVVDDQGNAFVSGATLSKDFPATSGAYQTRLTGWQNCYLFGLSKTGSLRFSTYFGSDGGDQCVGMARDRSGNLLLAGGSTGNIRLKNAMQSDRSPRTGYETPMLIKFSPLGGLLSSTYFGGTASGLARSIAADDTGFVYIAGAVDSGGLQGVNALQPNYPGAQSGFYAKLDEGLSTVLYASHFGASSGVSLVASIAVDHAGFVFLCGTAGAADFPQKDGLQNWKGGGAPLASDGFVAKLLPTGNSLVYATFLGGTSADSCNSIAPDGNGGVVVAGNTSSLDLPVRQALQPGAGGGFDGLLARISDSTPLPVSPLTLTPGQMVFRYTQGSTPPSAQIAAVSGGSFTAATSASWINVAVSSSTLSVSVDGSGLAPGTYTAIVTLRPSIGAPASLTVAITVFARPPTVASINPSLIAIGASDSMITLEGTGFQTNSIVVVNGIVWDVSPIQFVNPSTLRFSMPPAYFSVAYTHSIAVRNPDSQTSNAVTLSVGVLAPTFTAASVTNGATFVSGAVAPGEIVTVFGTNLAGSADFDDVPAALIYLSPSQMSVTVPYSVRGPTTRLRIGSSLAVDLAVVPSAPGIFAAVADDHYLTLYATGCGSLTHEDLPHCILPVSVTVNEQPAEVLYAGVAPGLPEGANQINVRLPVGVSSGVLRIVLEAGDAVSPEFPFKLP